MIIDKLRKYIYILLNIIDLNLLLIFFWGFILLTSCETKTSPPERLNNIPQNAIWYGGKDGGVWIKIDNGSKPNSFYLEIYNDYTGELESKGEYFVKECYNKQFSLNEISKLISAFDGVKVLLTEIEKGRNCYLEK